MTANFRYEGFPMLYLTSNAKAGLIGTAAAERELTVKKLVGKFSLKSFVTKDIKVTPWTLRIDCVIIFYY